MTVESEQNYYLSVLMKSDNTRQNFSMFLSGDTLEDRNRAEEFSKNIENMNSRIYGHHGPGYDPRTKHPITLNGNQIL